MTFQDPNSVQKVVHHPRAHVVDNKTVRLCRGLIVHFYLLGESKISSTLNCVLCFFVLVCRLIQNRQYLVAQAKQDQFKLNKL